MVLSSCCLVVHPPPRLRQVVGSSLGSTATTSTFWNALEASGAEVTSDSSDAPVGTFALAVSISRPNYMLQDRPAQHSGRGRSWEGVE